MGVLEKGCLKSFSRQRRKQGGVPGKENEPRARWIVPPGFASLLSLC